MTIEVMIVNADSRSNAIIEVSSKTGPDSLPFKEATLKGGESKKVLIWAEKTIEIKEIQNG